MTAPDGNGAAVLIQRDLVEHDSVGGPGHPNLNALWSSVLFDALAANGVRHVCIAPGSRSAPLAIGAHQHPDLRTWIHLDERSAAFFALGLARATGLPAALVCTSGTAGANFFPAVVEAARSRVPLLVLTADRPPEARDFGTHQTIDQVRLFGNHVRAFWEVPPPHGDPEQLRRLTLLAADAFYAAMGPPAGPVHLNLPFREPLSPISQRPDVVARVELGFRTTWPEDQGARVWRPAEQPAEGAVAYLAERLRHARRPLLVAGPGAVSDDADRLAVLELARAARLPVLADIASGLRFGGDPPPEMLTHAEGFLRVERLTSVAPDLVVALGQGFTSGRLSAYLVRHTPEVVRLQPDAIRQDPEALASTVICGPVGEICRQTVLALARSNGVQPPPANTVWLAACREADAAAGAVLGRLAGAADQPILPEGAATDQPTSLRMAKADRPILPHEAAVDHSILPHEAAADQSILPREAAAVVAAVGALPTLAGLFLSNSLPVRYAELCVPPDGRDIRVWVNRGASGIDGITSTALGAAAGSGRPLLLVTGDLAFLHDLGGLYGIRHVAQPVVILLLNNDGGGIFSHLPIAGYPQVCEPLCSTPHGIDPAPAAALFGMRYRKCETAAEVARSVVDALRDGGATLLEVRTRRDEEAARYQALLADMARAVDESLAERFPTLPFFESASLESAGLAGPRAERRA